MLCLIKKQNFTIQKKLVQLFKLNKKNLQIKNTNLIEIIANFNLIKNVYYKLKHKKKIRNKIDWKMLKNLSEQIKKGSYSWNNNKFLQYKKILYFKDQIVQKLIEIILNIIYEPVFQTLEYNYGFRQNKSIQMAVQKLKLQNQKWTYALKNKITSNNADINSKILTRSLRKKIKDPIFSQLLQNFLNNKSLLKNKTINFILYNIYTHEFDLYISKKIKEFKKKNREIKCNNFKLYQNLILKENSVKQNKFLWKTQFITLDKFSIQIFQKFKSSEKGIKKRTHKFKTQIQRKKNVQIIYNRYNNNWTMLTNYNSQKIQSLKNKLIKWFQKNLKKNLTQILIINLIKNRLNYLGFTFYIISPKIKKINYKNKIKARRKKIILLFVGIDRQYLKNKFLEKEILTPRYKPNHAIIYYNLKPIQILKKFKQKLEILVNYYYNTITHPSNLSYYYYIYKFSLLKTIAYKINKSITHVSMIYLNNMRIQKIIGIESNFPSYSIIMNRMKILQNNSHKNINLSIS